VTQKPDGETKLFVEKLKNGDSVAQLPTTNKRNQCVSGKGHQHRTNEKRNAPPGRDTKGTVSLEFSPQHLGWAQVVEDESRAKWKRGNWFSRMGGGQCQCGAIKNKSRGGNSETPLAKRPESEGGHANSDRKGQGLEQQKKKKTCARYRNKTKKKKKNNTRPGSAQIRQT